MSMLLGQTEAETSALPRSEAVIGHGLTLPFRVVSNPRVPHTRPNRHHHSSVDVSTISSTGRYQR
jgi:hypothetical protein